MYVYCNIVLTHSQTKRIDDFDDNDDESDDDTAELLAELQAIKKERREEELRQEAEKKAEEEKIRNENLLSGNPLLNYQTQSYKVKRRWDDDVVFKNCAKGEDSKGQHFINDTIRSEFHKKFMSKYIK
eukprot:TRINITY_DN969_c0_g1_i2.p1 TRINITY_DN969_c0_g1~~TRINITY_DN969_c0_g1_i2.p1  ORF type:complete len:128 (+),score=40.11 TRINITY_DN969_c0_g1_i2:120-503(+)